MGGFFMLLAGHPWLTLERHLVDERLGRGRRARTRLRRQGEPSNVYSTSTRARSGPSAKGPRHPTRGRRKRPGRTKITAFSSASMSVPQSEGIGMRLHKRMTAISALVPLLGIAVTPELLLSQQADRFAAVAPRMQEFVDKGEIAGVVTLIATRDRILHLGAVGKTDMAKDRKMRTDDIFWIASMTKPITAVCIAILADERKLSFDDPLARHLPEFAGLMVNENGQTAKPSRPVTLRDVMTHTSGIGEMNNREPHLTLAETRKRLSQQPLRFQPGSRWASSTAGMDVLGRVVEVAGGVPFDQFLQKRVLDPLGMKDTSFWIAPRSEEHTSELQSLR